MAEVNLAEIKFGGAVGDRQTAKLNYPPKFPAIDTWSIFSYVGYPLSGVLGVVCV